MNPLLLFVALGILLVSIAYFLGAKDRESFNARFPPISDAAFMARCAPGADPKIALGVRRIVADQLGVEYERIYPSSRFVEDLGAD
jgi:hypothetical protein